MALRILGEADDVPERIEAAIRAALPDAQVAVQAGGAAHYALAVTSVAFAGKSMVQQHQLVYRAIAPLMAGDAPPVHAIDRLTTKTP
jgi:stress-induced morphogen